MKKIKNLLFSEKGMRMVNVLFFLSAFFYRSGLLFIAYVVWIIYLLFCVKQTEAKGSKVVYSVFIGIAVIMICVNLYFFDSELSIKQLPVCRTDKNPLGTKGRISILS